jgi:hypothetical protein
MLYQLIRLFCVEWDISWIASGKNERLDGNSRQSQSQSYVTTDGQSASLSWCQVKTKFLLLSYSCGFVDTWHPLWGDDGSVVPNCCWLPPAQSFLGPSPAGLMIIFHSLRFETPPTWTTRSPYVYAPGTGWPSYNLRYRVPFPLPSRTHRVRWKYSRQPPHGRFNLPHSLTWFRSTQFLLNYI